MRTNEQNKLVLTVEEWKESGLTYWEYNADRKRKKLQATRGSRHKPVEIEFDSIKDESKKAKIIAKFGDPNNPVSNFREGPTLLDNYSTREIETALTQYSLVMAYRQATDHLEHGKKTAAKREWANLVSLGLVYKSALDKLNGKVSFQSLERWDKDMRQGNNTMDDLLPKKTEKQPSTILTKEQKDTLISIALGKNGLKITEIVNLAHRAWSQEKNQLPSASSCTKFLNEYKRNNYGDWVLNRMGKKLFNDLVMPYADRDPATIRFMDLWVADGHVLNCMVANPFTGKLCRPTLIMWIDFATHIPVGYELMYTENTQAVLSAFRNGCLWIGRMLGIDGGVLPRGVYMDNGKAFKNKFFTNSPGFEDQIEGLFSRLKPFGLEFVSFANPFNAQAKPIERLFSDFGFIERRIATYTGYNIDTKPADMKRDEKWHRALMQQYINQHGYPTLHGVYTITREFIENEYIQSESHGKYLHGCTPLELAHKQVHEIDNLERRCLASDHFRYMLMHTKVSSLTRNGFNVNGIWYFNELKFPGRWKGKDARGEQYEIMYDINDNSQILVYELEPTRRFWCTAKPALWNKMPVHYKLGSESDQERFTEGIKALETVKKAYLMKAKAAGNGVNLEFNQLPEHETFMLAENSGSTPKALAQHNEDHEDQDFRNITLPDGKIIKLY